MRKWFEEYKKRTTNCKFHILARISTSWEYGDVSPARYPNPGRKKKSGPAKGSNPNGKKKKEEENEAITIQNMKPIGLDAFKKK